MLTGNETGRKYRISPKAKIPGIAEVARRMNRTEAHVYYVLSGERKIGNSADYHRVHAEVLSDAGFKPFKPGKPLVHKTTKNKKALSDANR